jgi:NitT/TauT family transport system substrate-binding protein
MNNKMDCKRNNSMIRAFLFAALILIASPLLFARGAGESGEPLTIKAAVFKGPSGFGMVKMMESPPEFGDGSEVRIEVLPTPQEMVARVSSGEIDIAVFPTNLAAKMYTAGPGYPMAAVSGYGLLHLLSRDTDIRSWADMEGETVHTVGKGASPDFLLRYFLSRAGLDPVADLKIDYSIQAAPQLAQALIAGKVSHAVLPEPFATLVNVRDPSVKRVIDLQKSWTDLYGGGGNRSYPITVAVVSPKLAEERPELVRLFFEAYRDSIEWVNSNPEEAAQLIEKYDIMPAAIAAPAIPNCNLAYSSAADSRKEVEEYLRVLLDFDPASVGGKLPDKGFYLD